ncbi:CRISPR-associated helicase Cas3' [Telmatospirillum sp.]|uniref:CRISPR-associated helicase Cas3' n=1 Tax=Telmatospirillum sp. TaxID=2079197 RepID=UPI00283D7671|nr:CRISPR-associated helicase Cas3' [Telmatospirillum sp.]MDR3439164.1 CRISPR-associated helicase Cas3' [Telmatospirillum sp.]
MTLDKYITHYWAKTRSLLLAGFPWHPVAYHCLDVAAAMDGLLRIRPQWLHDLAKSTGLPVEETRKRLLLVAALHDLGKFAENFQWKVPELALQFGHAARDSDAGHGTVGRTFWQRHEAEQGLSHLTDWMFAGFSHHGVPVDVLRNLTNPMSSGAETDALLFTRDILAFFGLPTPDKPAKRKYELWRVAGLVILADWIGSNQERFPCTAPTLGLADYWNQAVDRATAAIAVTDLAEAPVAATLGLADILDDKPRPTPLQAWAEDQAPDAGPHLYLIEDLTGAGKTEAALILCHRLMRAGAAEGLYWALPSMATANGLYGRLEIIYKKLFAPTGPEPSLVLAHSARDLNEAFQLSIRGQVGAVHGAGDQDVSAEAACAAFIAEDRKKTFLAQVGVGTLDQALLGVLPVRHQSLRLAALSRRVLVIDEAHAYDDYMTKGLERLLAFQKALGGSAVILSATLTQEQRRRFTTAFGADRDALHETAFPLATHVGPNETTEKYLPSSRGTRRDLPFRRFDSPDAVVEALLAEARKGACAVYIRNSVKEAMATYDALAARWDKVDLFHARFCLGDRIDRENDILARFGKGSRPEQRRGRILVATQVVEQSLDLDFDVMATDLCPMDLLIQRAGRLQRHRHRPPRPDPVLWVVSQAAEWEVAADWYGALFPSGQYVYPDAGQLWRTLSVLQTAGGLPLKSGSPRDLIEPVFGPDSLETPGPLDEISRRAEAKRTSDTGMAYLNFLKPGDFTTPTDAWSTDVRTPTRLGDPTLALRLATWTNGILRPWRDDGPKSWRLSEITIRCALFDAALPPDDDADRAIQALSKDWATAGDPPPVLALLPTDRDDVWQGRWMARNGHPLAVQYSRRNGLRID